MKICMITPNKYPVPAIKGGAVEGLVEMFVEQNERLGQVDLTVVSCYDPAAIERSRAFQKTKFIYLPYGNLADRIHRTRIVQFLNRMFVMHRGKAFFEQSYIKRIYKRLKNENFDLIVIEGGDYSLYSYFSRKFGRERLCFHVHGVMQGTWVMNQWFSHFICISNYVARNLIMDGKVKTECVDVLRNAIELSLFDSEEKFSREEERKKYGITKSELVYIFWGRLVPGKGVKELLHAFQLVTKTKKAKLVIVGNPEFAYQVEDSFTAELKKISEENRDLVLFTGFIPRENLWRVLKMADIAVLPSIWNEGVALAVLEALAVGLPLITTNVGGIPEYVSAETAILLSWTPNFIQDLSTAMSKLADDIQLRQSLSLRAKETAKTYNARTYYVEYCNLMRNYILGKDRE